MWGGNYSQWRQTSNYICDEGTKEDPDMPGIGCLIQATRAVSACGISRWGAGKREVAVCPR